MTVRAHGEDHPSGHPEVVFLITSSGRSLSSSSPVPGLATLVGWGPSGSSNTVSLVQHLGFG